ncbi:MAG: hypothetical protein ACJASZ_000301 [Yoonia sp.]|jgi:hypothetical protein
MVASFVGHYASTANSWPPSIARAKYAEAGYLQRSSHSNDKNCPSQKNIASRISPGFPCGANTVVKVKSSRTPAPFAKAASLGQSAPKPEPDVEANKAPPIKTTTAST